METIGTPLMWTVFTVLVLVALAVDLLVLRQNGPHKVSTREAVIWSLAWIGLAMVFNVGLWWYLQGQMPAQDADRIALEFLTGYLVEKALAVDNIFVFLMLFTYFAVPPQSQQRVLILGVLGAIVLRGILIFVGAALIAQFHWILYIFGVFLLVTGAKMLWAAGQEPDMDKNPVLRWLTGRFPMVRRYHGEALWLGEGRRRKYTPLFIVLVMIAITDVIFAVDSIPAIFAITTDPFIVLTSNVFAVLGLRALYFLLAGAAEKFHLLAYGLAMVLIFIGAKMLIVDIYKIPVAISLGVVAATIATSMVMSLWIQPRPPKHLQPPR
ncbi:membrane protein [Arenimonas soli]|uniref:Membrane protein n=1 Tax=Arenimonas soli TaxID=2269504 RepID=A0ABQ1HLC7_9GAMM|nr:TerC family protein [Arenimonas soli]GGA80975.1 membrane protein [Arenimonas soli]